MFAKLKNIFSSVEPKNQDGNNNTAAEIEREISLLESNLLKNPADSDTQKKLMIKYNQAVKSYALNSAYRPQVDAVFVKMDDLRNTIRKNI